MNRPISPRCLYAFADPRADREPPVLALAEHDAERGAAGLLRIVLIGTGPASRRSAELVKRLRAVAGERVERVTLPDGTDPWSDMSVLAALRASAALRQVARERGAEHLVCASSGTQPQRFALRTLLIEAGAQVAYGSILHGRAVFVPIDGGAVAPGEEDLRSGLDAQIRRLSQLPSSEVVLIEGPTGAGKTHLAQRLHDAWTEAQDREPRGFVSENVAAIPAERFLAELVGWEAGAFTGAVGRNPGLLRRADRGTLLLDEIGELTRENQVKLLRILESAKLHQPARAILPLGASRDEPVDVHVVLATNVDLRDAVAEGRFRKDLFARIRAHRLTLTPLAERRGEILQGYLEVLGPYAALPEESRRILDEFARDPARSDWTYGFRDVRDSAARLLLDAPRGTGMPEITPAVVIAELEALRAGWAELPVGLSRARDGGALERWFEPEALQRLSALDRFHAGLLVDAWRRTLNKARAWRLLVAENALPRPNRRAGEPENASARFSAELRRFPFRDGAFDLDSGGPYGRAGRSAARTT